MTNDRIYSVKWSKWSFPIIPRSQKFLYVPNTILQYL